MIRIFILYLVAFPILICANIEIDSKKKTVDDFSEVYNFINKPEAIISPRKNKRSSKASPPISRKPTPSIPVEKTLYDSLKKEKPNTKVVWPYTPKAPNPNMNITNNLQTQCSNPVIEESFVGDKLFHSFSSNEEVSYKLSDDERIFYISLSNFSLEEMMVGIKYGNMFLIRSDFVTPSNYVVAQNLGGNSLITNKDGIKRLELGLNFKRRHPLNIVMENNSGFDIVKCEVSMMKKGSNMLQQYIKSDMNPLTHNVVFKIYIK